jgi:protein-S-isoprenylcysteine O-methyltransferase Ste14
MLGTMSKCPTPPSRRHRARLVGRLAWILAAVGVVMIILAFYVMQISPCERCLAYNPIPFYIGILLIVSALMLGAYWTFMWQTGSLDDTTPPPSVPPPGA